jgi:hypothetical protein
MLLLEYEVAADPAAIARGRGEIAHFSAVSSYVLQHPHAGNGGRLTCHAAGRVRLRTCLLPRTTDQFSVVDTVVSVYGPTLPFGRSDAESALVLLLYDEKQGTTALPITGTVIHVGESERD